MKKTFFCLTSFIVTVALNASITFLSTALSTPPGLSVGDVGVIIVDNNNTGFGSLMPLDGGSITSSATYSGFTVIGNATAANPFGTAITFSGAATFNLGSGVDLNDKFGILVYSASTTNATANDTFSIWTAANWLVPADGANMSFNSDFTQMNSGNTANFSGTVTAVPEPSTYALIVGGLVMGFAVYRKRRAK